AIQRIARGRRARRRVRQMRRSRIIALRKFIVANSKRLSVAPTPCKFTQRATAADESTRAAVRRQRQGGGGEWRGRPAVGLPPCAVASAPRLPSGCPPPCITAATAASCGRRGREEEQRRRWCPRTCRIPRGGA
ncbi:unnamed protein product, partial [Heterosigma akashiwo]